jgi:hypothetical protein
MGLTSTDLVGEIFQERGGALDVVEFEDAFEDLGGGYLGCGVTMRADALTI